MRNCTAAIHMRIHPQPRFHCSPASLFDHYINVFVGNESGGAIPNPIRFDMQHWQLLLLSKEPTWRFVSQLSFDLQLQQQLPQLQLSLHYATTCYNYKDITLHYTTLHPAVAGKVTTATTPKIITPTTFRSISGFALASTHHNSSPPL